MQKQEPERSNPEFPDIRIAETNSMRRKRRKSILALALMGAFLFTSANAQETQKDGLSSTSPVRS
jgi:hypothetical protein